MKEKGTPIWRVKNTCRWVSPFLFFIVVWAAGVAWATGSGASGSFHSRGEEALVPPNNPEYRNIVDLEMQMRKDLEEEKSKAWKDYGGEIKEDTNVFLGER